MALNITGTYQLKSISQTATFPHKGDFNDGCITIIDITGTGSNTTFAFANLPTSTVDCGPTDFRSRFSRYFDWVHNGAAYPVTYGYNTSSNAPEVIIGRRAQGYLFSYGKPVVVASSTTSTTATASSTGSTTGSTTGTAKPASSAASTNITTGTSKASATSDSVANTSGVAASSSTGDTAKVSASSNAPSPSVVYVAPTNSYVAPKTVPSNLYKGAAMKESLSAAAIAAVFALLF
ncbi:hypothetical protein HDU81_004560 [Chytriomyces hyalinus]|nr:hypothetical protein HDU81_004560 [Chytriomyces hyalinus]